MMAVGIRILYFDDEPAMLDIVKLFLERSGDFTVTIATSAPDAIRLLEQERFDAIIADYLMPGMDGIQFLGLVRAKFGQIPFILFTGKGREDVVIQAINAGADFYLQKGGDPGAQFAELSHQIKSAVERKRAEDALVESEERHRILLNEFPDPIFSFYPDGTYRHVNRAFAEGVGKSVDQIIGKKIWNVFPKDEADKRFSALHTVFSTGESNEIEVRVPRSDGDRYYVTTIVPVKDESGSVVSAICSSKDITERKRAEEALLRQSATLSILNAIITTANKADNLPELLESILAESLRLLDFDAGGIYLVDRSTRTANVVHSKNLPPGFLTEIQTVSIDKKPYDTLFIKNEPIITENYAQIAPDQSKKYGFQSMASIPLLSKGVAIGALNIASTRRYVISEEQNQALISISRELGSTIERMAAEEEAKKAAKNLETLFNSIDEMVFVLDMQGRILAVNNAVFKRLSYTPEELIGTDVLLLHVPERRNEALRNVQGMIAGTIDSCPVPVLAKDGTRFEVETKVTRGWWNDKEVLIGVTRDVTERKQTEAAMRESRARFEVTLASLDDAVFLVDPATRLISECNEATTRIFGYSHEELVGRETNFLHVDQAHLEQFGREANATYENPGYYTREFEMRRKDGRVFPTEHFVRPVRDPDGRILYVVSVVRDITARKKAEEAIRHALAEKEVLLREIHHRVKNNLAGILALIELQISSLSDPAAISLLNDMETRIRSMALVHESLSLTEDLARINVASYTETLTRYLLQVYGTATEVRCTIDMGDVTMSIETAIPCGLVMNEIVTNSLKYAFPPSFSCGEIRGEPSTITLTLHREGSDYLLKIADNGIGIPEGIDVTMSHSLGLFLIRFIVEHQLRGSLLISTAGGIAYTIRFPEPVVKERNTDE